MPQSKEPAAFKIGDRVICIDSTDSRGDLIRDKIYIIIKYDIYSSSSVYLKDVKLGCYASRFKLVEPRGNICLNPINQPAK